MYLYLGTNTIDPRDISTDIVTKVTETSWVSPQSKKVQYCTSQNSPWQAISLLEACKADS